MNRVASISYTLRQSRDKESEVLVSSGLKSLLYEASTASFRAPCPYVFSPSELNSRVSSSAFLCLIKYFSSLDATVSDITIITQY